MAQPRAYANTYRGLPPNLEPRGLDRHAAAAYICVSPSKFDELVQDGRMPKPKRIDSRIVWDRRQIDEAFEALPEKTADVENEWDEVAR